MIPIHRRLLASQPVDRDQVLKHFIIDSIMPNLIMTEQSRDLPPLEVGDKVRFRPNGEKEWRKRKVMPRSDMLKDEYGRAYRRNRRKIIGVPNDFPKTGAPPLGTQPQDSPASTKQAPVLEKPASSSVRLERETETIAHTPIATRSGR